jgi:spermidine synthase
VIPWQLLDSVETPDGSELGLYRRGEEFSMRIEGREVMNSRQHGSEEALARFACSALSGCSRARVLIGGLGMGFTLAAALERLADDAEAVVAELIPEVVAWNRGPLAEPAGAPLRDRRVSVREQDVAQLIRTQPAAFDAIMLDVDNSPDSLIQAGNGWLYTKTGLAAIHAALKPGRILTVWSVAPVQAFTKRLRAAGFTVEERTVRARDTDGAARARGARHHIWIATARATRGSR